MSEIFFISGQSEIHFKGNLNVPYKEFRFDQKWI